jgi:hypothetical protein
MSKNYCSLLGYVKSKHTPLFNEITSYDGLCADMLFKPRKVGMTLLMPSKKVADHIVKLSKQGKGVEAVEIIKMHLIPGLLDNAARWNEHKANIPNLNGKKVEVKEAKGDTVEFEGGAKAKLSKDSPREDRQNMAVWELTGELKESQRDADRRAFNNLLEKKSAPEHIREEKMDSSKSKPKTKGGARQAYTDRRAFAQFVAYQDKLELMKACRVKNNPNHKTCDPYLNSVCSALAWVKCEHPECFKSLVLALCPCPKTSFYILFEPFRSGGSLLFPWFNDWQAETLGYFPSVDAKADYMNMFKALDEDCKDDAHACTKTGRAVLCDALNKSRVDLLTKKYAAGVPTLQQEVQRVYSQISSDNSFTFEGSDGKSVTCDNVFPPHLASYFSQNAALKATQDEFRYCFPMFFDKLQCMPEASIWHYHTGLVNTIEAVYSFNNSDMEQLPMLTCLTSQAIGNMDTFSTIVPFVKSTSYMYLAYADAGECVSSGLTTHKSVDAVDSADGMDPRKMELTDVWCVAADCLSRSIQVSKVNTYDPMLKMVQCMNKMYGTSS